MTICDKCKVEIEKERGFRLFITPRNLGYVSGVWVQKEMELCDSCANVVSGFATETLTVFALKTFLAREEAKHL